MRGTELISCKGLFINLRTDHGANGDVSESTFDHYEIIIHLIKSHINYLFNHITI